MGPMNEAFPWRSRMTVDKYRLKGGRFLHVARERYGPNTLTDTGANIIIQKLTIGGGTSGAWDGHFGESDASPYEGAYIGVGTTSTAASSSDTDLGSAGTANAYYKEMENGFPKHSDGTAISAGSTERLVEFKAEFGTSVANFAWREAVIGAVGTNPATGGAAGGSLTLTDTGGTFDNKILNRVVESMGTKTSSDTWTVEFTVGH